MPDIEQIVGGQADPAPRLFECPTCGDQHPSQFAASDCCDPFWRSAD